MASRIECSLMTRLSGSDSAFALALLAHAMILAITSVGGAVAALRLGVGLSTGASDRSESPAT